MLGQRSEGRAFIGRLLAGEHGTSSGVVLFGGCIGSGKTELLRELVRDAEATGTRYLMAAGSPDETAIPLGVVCQLLHSAPWITERVDTALGRLDSLMFAAGTTEEVARTTNTNAEALRLAHELANALFEVAGTGPVLIVVDDVDHADTASLNCLHHLAKRSVGTLLTLVYTVSMRTRAARPALPIEPVDSVGWHRFVLRNLSEAGVGRTVAEHFGIPEAADLAARYHRATGGNPRLLRALLEDAHTPEDAPAAGGGSRFGQAVAVCLRRADAHVVAVAEAAAVLAASDSLATASTRFLARLVDREPEQVAGALAALDAMGITAENGRAFRHPAARAAILAGAGRERLDDLHARTARQLPLDDSAVAPARVAVHLTAAGRTTDSQSREILVRAGSTLTAAEDLDSATRYLELAMASADTERTRAGIRAMLARTEMRVDPAAAKHHMGALLDAYKNDHLADREGGLLLWQLVWQGMLDEAGAVIDWTADGNVTHAVSEFTSYRRLLAVNYPPLVADPDRRAATEPDRPAQVYDELRTTAAEALGRVLSHGPADSAAERAHRVVATLELADETIDIAEAALETLVFGEQAPDAAPHCATLLDDAQNRSVPLWSAVLGSVRAEIALRQGHLVAARRFAAKALSAIPAHGWGAQSGRTLGVLVLASTALDDFAAAAKYVQSPVPEVTFASRYGAQYLYARGQYYLAAGHVDAALADFEFCGRLLVGWGMDTPTFVPWRSGAAAVHLRKGDPSAAQGLLEQQFALLDGAGARCLRTRGLTTMMLGCARQARQRVPILREAITSLRASGDMYLLSRAMLALSDTHKTLGQRDQATALRCGAMKLDRIFKSGSAPHNSPESGEISERQAAVSDDPVRTALTESEQRVAALAAVGHTNREIADRVHITVSTVEQHLTSVYRKLDVKRRADLPIELLLRATN